MLKELTNFVLIRTGKEAFVFYCTYLLLIIIGVIALSGTIDLLFGIDASSEKNYIINQRIGTMSVLLICTFLAYRILESKNLVNNYSSYLFLATTAALAFLGGALLGMLPVAYLTTRRPASEILPTSPAPTEATPPQAPPSIL
jgi:hypothetical protein